MLGMDCITSLLSSVCFKSAIAHIRSCLSQTLGKQRQHVIWVWWVNTVEPR